jgi:hypothetical protein
VAHNGLAVYHVNRDSTAIPAREKVVKKPEAPKEPTAIEKQAVQEAKMPLEHICYSLMDSAYDAKDIDKFYQEPRRIPVIDPNKRKDNECLRWTRQNRNSIRYRPR